VPNQSLTERLHLTTELNTRNISFTKYQSADKSRQFFIEVDLTF